MTTKYNIKLYYHPLCPFSRKIRIILDEFNLQYTSIPLEKFPQKKQKNHIKEINPLGNFPILIANNQNGQIAISDTNTIIDFIRSITNIDRIINSSLMFRPYILETTAWIDKNFFFDVTREFLNLTLKNTKENQTSTNQKAKNKELLTKQNNLIFYLNKFEKVIKQLSYIATNRFSLADITLASHISILDYLNLIQWNKYPALKEWYGIIKSKPSFKTILEDYVENIYPPEHYSMCDF